MSLRFVTSFLFVGCATAAASGDAVRQAATLYERTDYKQSLHVLAGDPRPDAEAYLLSGKNWFMLGDYKRALEFFQKAAALAPADSDYQLWMGRAWGKRAEAGSWLVAGVYASRARQCFERAVALDAHNPEAKNDLFDFYLNAPGFMGGGIDKAEGIARSIAQERPPEAEFEQAQIADRRKDYAAEEAHLRRAMALAPNEPGRIVDVARYLAKQGRLAESDALFEQARKLAPDAARVAFAQARVDIEHHRHLEQARDLLEQYLRSSLTPDDPPREEAQKLLRRAGG